MLGPGFILLDGGIRTTNVYHAWQNGDQNWRKKAFVEGGSFTAGLIAGVMIGAVIAATPVGLVIGIVAGGAAAVGADYLFKDVLGRLYDLLFG